MSAPSYDELLRAIGEGDPHAVNGCGCCSWDECRFCWATSQWDMEDERFVLTHKDGCLYVRAQQHLPHHDRMRDG